MPIFGGGRKGIGIGNSNISDAGIVGGGNSSGNSISDGNNNGNNNGSDGAMVWYHEGLMNEQCWRMECW